MKFLQTLASSSGFRDPDHNPHRLALLDRLLGVAKEQNADLLILPGGYLTVRTGRELPAALDEVRSRADRANVGVIGGVDRPPPTAGGPKAVAVGKRGRQTELPYYGFAVGPVAVEAGADAVWEQTSSTNTNAWDVPPEDVPGAGRVVRAGGSRLGVLICGELFSSRARESMAGCGVDLVVDLGHVGMGTGVTRAMENIAKNGGCAVAHAQHVRWWGASHHFVGADGRRDSAPTSDDRYVGGDDFWVGWCLRTV